MADAQKQRTPVELAAALRARAYGNYVDTLNSVAMMREAADLLDRQQSDVTLTREDIERLIPLLENAIAEVEHSAAPDSGVLPDDSIALMAADDWGRGLLRRLKATRE